MCPRYFCLSTIFYKVFCVFFFRLLRNTPIKISRKEKNYIIDKFVKKKNLKKNPWGNKHEKDALYAALHAWNRIKRPNTLKDAVRWWKRLSEEQKQGAITFALIVSVVGPLLILLGTLAIITGLVVAAFASLISVMAGVASAVDAGRHCPAIPNRRYCV